MLEMHQVLFWTISWRNKKNQYVIGMIRSIQWLHIEERTSFSENGSVYKPFWYIGCIMVNGSRLWEWFAAIQRKHPTVKKHDASKESLASTWIINESAKMAHDIWWSPWGTVQKIWGLADKADDSIELGHQTWQKIGDGFKSVVNYKKWQTSEVRTMWRMM